MEKINGLIVPNGMTKELLEKSLDSNCCASEGDNCPAINGEQIGCGKCFMSVVNNRVAIEEYLKGGNKVEFKVGDRVELIKDYGYAKKGMTGTIKKYKKIEGHAVKFDESFEDGHDCHGLCEDGKGHFVKGKYLKLINKQIKEEVMNVNSTVAKVFKNTDDAILVSKYLGSEYEENNHRAYLDLKANDKVVLAEAKRLEKEEKAKEK